MIHAKLSTRLAAGLLAAVAIAACLIPARRAMCSTRSCAATQTHTASTAVSGSTSPAPPRVRPSAARWPNRITRAAARG